jgi:hypothetical protein
MKSIFIKAKIILILLIIVNTAHKSKSKKKQVFVNNVVASPQIEADEAPPGSIINSIPNAVIPPPSGSWNIPFPVINHSPDLARLEQPIMRPSIQPPMMANPPFMQAPPLNRFIPPEMPHPNAVVHSFADNVLDPYPQPHAIPVDSQLTVGGVQNTIDQNLVIFLNYSYLNLSN